MMKRATTRSSSKYSKHKSKQEIYLFKIHSQTIISSPSHKQHTAFTETEFSFGVDNERPLIEASFKRDSSGREL